MPVLETDRMSDTLRVTIRGGTKQVSPTTSRTIIE